MKISRNLLLTVAIGWMACSAQAELTYRYTFSGNANDSEGTANGTLTAAGTNTEAPQFINAAPTGTVVGAPTQSIQLGADPTKKSGFTLIGSSALTNAGSMSVWFNTSTIGAGDYLFAGDINIVHETTGSVSFFSGAFAPIPGARTITVAANTWNHAVVTWDNDADTMTAYLNGTELGTLSSTFNIAGNQRVGGFNMADTTDNLAAQYQGSLYDLQFYDNILSSADVTALNANPGSVIPEPGTYALIGGMLALGAVMLRRRR